MKSADMQSTPHVIMTVADAAAYCQVTPTTIREWIRAGLPAMRPSPRTTRIRRADLDAWLESQGQEAS